MNFSSKNLYQHATALYRQGRRPQAIDAYRRLLEVEPTFADGWYDLGYLLKQQGEHKHALAAYAQALNYNVRGAEEVHLNCAVIYSDHLRQDEAAQKSLNAALAINPNYAPALLNLGNLHEEHGRRAEAITCYQVILDATTGPGDDLQLEALARLAQLRPPQSADDPALGQLQRAASSAGADPQTRSNLYFALGRALDSLAEYDRAFDAFERGNRLASTVGPAYSTSGSEQRFEAIIRRSQQASEPAHLIHSDREPQPLFVCGMFRSGSTLIEQVISGHAQVGAGGELDHFPRLAAASGWNLSADQAQAWASKYRAHLASIASADSLPRFVTDKRPDNFLLIGMIKRMFPQAKIIHTIRNPLDNGLSLFVQHLDQRVAPHSSDLRAIGHYYAQYRRLMRHWANLYGADIHHFDYDAFVADPKPSLTALFDFLDLPNDPNCLQFHQRRNSVKTASYWQVRRPLYRDASGRWKNYSTRLAPLRDSLAEAGIDDLD